MILQTLMTPIFDDLLAYCLSKPGSYEDHPFGLDSTVIKVKAPSQLKGRIFAQLFYLKGEPKLTVNCDMLTGEYYRATYPGVVVRGYHCPPVQQPYFNTVSLDGSLPDDEIKLMIDQAYTVVVAKLPKKHQRELISMG